MELTIIIPAFNEAGSISELVNGVREHVGKKVSSFELLVIASRYVSGGGADMPFYRYMLSRILNFVFLKLLSVPVKDLSSGFREKFKTPVGRKGGKGHQSDHQRRVIARHRHS